MTSLTQRWHAAGKVAAVLMLALAGGCASVVQAVPAAAATQAQLTDSQPMADAPPLVQPAVAASEPAPVATAETEEAPSWSPAARARLDADEAAARGDLWLRLRGGFTINDLDGPLVRKWEQFYADQPEYVERMTARASRYLYHVLDEVEKRELPSELALLPFIESAFNPQAMSRARASGMWQFMPATGRDFDLRQNIFRDDRRDVLASTRAALDYLQQLYVQFGDWPLALAAYNWGQGSVLKAQARNRKAGLATDYASLRMPDETRNYVPKLQAIKNIVLRPEAYALALPPLLNHPFFQSVAVERDIDVSLAARLAGLTLDEFQQLNPQMNKPVILAAGTPQILLPYDNANLFVRELATHRGALASWTAWVAPRTLKPAEAARLTGMDEVRLREFNAIPPRMLIKSGSTLLVPRAAHATADVSELLAEHASISLTPEARPPRQVHFKAGRQGETVAAAAARLRLPAADLARWNGVGSQARFKPGQSIVAFVPERRAGQVRALAESTKGGQPAARKRKAAPPARTRVAASSQPGRPIQR
ncbi:Membrane-bound lytic murein transglycosylase D precursor [Rubrivivax sp. A210]|uniref:transglycosylase SLT domain-containing protein n=1 Tax=Rubrivivax sp. A210 TaxID=2772301 RepID=UPI0019190C6D|nr:transglycosylase SLT domain-containing protein [Rubrivivax sp. A210]CAD5373671.1 Membrane-bound lytic murein transglycosylase D precursor [Rubrivivax sp. A210]